MNSQNDENMKELFERFLSAEQAESGVEDIQKGEHVHTHNLRSLRGQASD